jgi:DNA-binding MarR family transcriptional regulator
VDAEETRWLSAAEREAWVAFVGVLIKLPYALDADTKRRSGISHFEYLVLSVLSEPADRTVPMAELAALSNSSLSRLSHVVARLEERGWVHRSPCPDNGRVTNATLTDVGFAVLAAAAPGHVSTVRSLVMDALSPTQVQQLADISQAILGRLDPGGEWPPNSGKR